MVLVGGSADGFTNADRAHGRRGAKILGGSLGRCLLAQRERGQLPAALIPSGRRESPGPQRLPEILVTRIKRPAAPALEASYFSELIEGRVARGIPAANAERHSPLGALSGGKCY